MTSMSRPKDLNSDHRNTLNKIFQHPASHNVEWHDVLSLLAAIGSVARHRDNKVAVTVGSETRFFDMPEHKDVEVDSIVDLRRLLTDAGYGNPTD
jgi:CMP-N-acetylneuraminic acid synthetase